MSQLERNAISPANAISEILTQKKEQHDENKERKLDEKYPANIQAIAKSRWINYGLSQGICKK